MEKTIEQMKSGRFNVAEVGKSMSEDEINRLQ